MSERLDELLRGALVEPPEGFAERVVAAISVLPVRRPSKQSSRVREVAEWLAVAGAVLAGVSQLVSFMFGLWIVGSGG
jgi:hypothetical protein